MARESNWGNMIFGLICARALVVGRRRLCEPNCCGRDYQSQIKMAAFNLYAKKEVYMAATLLLPAGKWPEKKKKTEVLACMALWQQCCIHASAHEKLNFRLQIAASRLVREANTMLASQAVGVGTLDLLII